MITWTERVKSFLDSKGPFRGAKQWNFFTFSHQFPKLPRQLHIMCPLPSVISAVMWQHLWSYDLMALYKSVYYIIINICLAFPDPIVHARCISAPSPLVSLPTLQWSGVTDLVVYPLTGSSLSCGGRWAKYDGIRSPRPPTFKYLQVILSIMVAMVSSVHWSL